MTILNIENNKNSFENEFINQFFVTNRMTSIFVHEKSNVISRDEKQNHISMFYFTTQNEIMIDNLFVNEKISNFFFKYRLQNY